MAKLKGNNRYFITYNDNLSSFRSASTGFVYFNSTSGEVVGISSQVKLAINLEQVPAAFTSYVEVIVPYVDLSSDTYGRYNFTFQIYFEPERVTYDGTTLAQISEYTKDQPLKL